MVDAKLRYEATCKCPIVNLSLTLLQTIPSLLTPPDNIRFAYKIFTHQPNCILLLEEKNSEGLYGHFNLCLINNIKCIF